MLPALAVAAGGAVLGGIAGAGGKKSSSSGSSTSTVNLRNFEDINKGASALENAAYQGQLSGYQDLSSLVGAGPGMSDVMANQSFQNQFASQLQQLLSQASTRQAPGQVQANFAEARDLFAPEQELLNQQFADANTSSNRLAARLGRAGNDPILRNKLFQEQTRQQSLLNAQIGSYGRQLPDIQANRIMQLGGSLSNLRQGLATQALQNRQTLLGMGNQLAQAERQYRLDTATRTNATQSTEKSGGGIGGAITGALGGASAFMGLGGLGGGNTGTFSPSSQQASPMVGNRPYLTGNVVR